MTSSTTDSIPQARARDWPWLLSAFLLVACLRVFLFFHTEVTARDSIGFIRQALDFEQRPWTDVLNHYHQHPGYPFLVWLVSLPLRAWAGNTEPALMQSATQLVSLFAALGLVAPVYYLGKILRDRWLGLGSTLLLQFLPLTGQSLSDGISDGLNLCWVAWALCFLAWGLQGNRPIHFALAGLFIALGYLTRPEAALVLAATLTAMALYQFHPAWSRPGRLFLRQVLALMIPVLLVGGPFALVVGKLTTKPSPLMIFEQDAHSQRHQEPVPCEIGGRGPLFAWCFGATFHLSKDRGKQLWFTTKILTLELVQAFHYFGFLGVLLGLLFYRRFAFLQIFYLSLIYFLYHLAVLFALGMKVGYISERHVMVLTMLCCFLAMHGILEFSKIAIGLLGPTRFSPRLQSLTPAILVVALLAPGLPKTFEKLHYNREGNLKAGLWLAEHRRPGDAIDDDHCWSHYFAGMVFLEHKDNPPAPGYQPRRYTVMTRSRDPEIARQRLEVEAALRRKNGQVVFHWPEKDPAEKARVVVYQTPLEPATSQPALQVQPVSRPREVK